MITVHIERNELRCHAVPDALLINRLATAGIPLAPVEIEAKRGMLRRSETRDGVTYTWEPAVPWWMDWRTWATAEAAALALLVLYLC